MKWLVVRDLRKPHAARQRVVGEDLNLHGWPESLFPPRHAASGPLVDVLAEGSGNDTTSVSGREEQSVFRCARKLRGYSPALTSDTGPFEQKIDDLFDGPSETVATRHRSMRRFATRQGEGSARRRRCTDRHSARPLGHRDQW